MVYTGLERRRFARVEQNFVVYYSMAGESHDYNMSLTRNISAGGILFTANQKFQQGQTLSLKLRLPQEFSPIAVNGKVVGWDQVADALYNIHIEFIGIAQKQLEAIKGTVDFFLRKKEVNKEG